MKFHAHQSSQPDIENYGLGTTLIGGEAHGPCLLPINLLIVAKDQYTLIEQS